MSRVANKPILLADNVKIESKGGIVSVEGPKGKLQCNLLSPIEVEIKQKELFVKRPGDDKQFRMKQGTMHRSISMMIEGVSKGFIKKLKIEGVGFRSELKGKVLTMQLGYSHNVEMPVPEGLSVKVDKMTELSIEGISKQAVGQFAADIRAAYKPEPYKGKGVRYVDEVVRRKAGKAVVK